MLPDLHHANPDKALLGGKAAALARLAAAGFDVPRGFVIPADRDLTAADDGGEVAAALAELGDGQAVAVRSSAVDEDGEEASFAGQHATLLNVRGIDELNAAIRECRASLVTESAAEYRRNRGGNAGARMAVLVQQMVDARAAGVAFTVDPVTGDGSRIVVEAVAGLGDALVSGQREGRRYTFARNGLALLDEQHLSDQPLSEDEARAVAKLALAAENEFGSPQDIEFAFDAANLWLLQSRPITGLARPAGPGEFDTPTSPDDLWTSANIGEVLPGLLTPLTITAFAERGNEAYARAYQGLKMLSRDEFPRFVGFFYNRAFLHVGNTRLIADRAFGSSADAVEERFLGAEKVAKGRRPHTLKNLKHRLLSLLPLLSMLRGIVKRGDDASERTLAAERRIRAIDLHALSGAQLDDVRLEIAELVADTFAVHLQASGCAGAGYDLVARMVRPILKDETEGRMPALFAGMRDVESARISLDLWELSRVTVADGLGDDIRQPGFDPAMPQLSAAWRAAYARFIERHGHRGLSEMEPAIPNWRRDPAQVFALVADYLEIDPAHAPPAVLERRATERIALTRQLDRQMNPLKRRIFRRVLRDAQAWVGLREHTKSVVVRGTRLVDVLIPEAAERLVAGSLIAEPEDIYFITGDELAGALRGNTMPDLRAVVSRRRRDFERNRHIRLPERFQGQPAPLPAPEAAEGDTLRGTPVSPGSVTGRARVIFDPRTDGPLAPGEILVAPVTDAGWTPLFALASGLVVDMGSALSHGSTVAREYGLPAVVNVRTATATIHTGDLIAVDGVRGTVVIVERA